MKDEIIELQEAAKKPDDSAKVLITKEAEKALIEAVERVCDGFEGGCVFRTMAARDSGA